MRAAIEVVRWFGNEARRVYQILDEPDSDPGVGNLVEWIEKRGGVVTARDLTKGLRAYRGKAVAAEVELQALVDQGQADWEDTAGPGRPTRRARLRPRVTVTETNGGMGEGSRRDVFW